MPPASGPAFFETSSSPTCDSLRPNAVTRRVESSPSLVPVPPLLRGQRWRALAGLPLLASVACTQFEPGDDVLLNSNVDSLMGTQSADEEPAEGEDFECVTPESLEPVDAQLVMPTAGTPVVMQRLQFLTLGPGVPPAGALVHACALPDVDCRAPLTDDYTLDAEGWVELPLYEGFNGYIELRGDTVMPTLVFLGKPLERPRSTAYPIAIVESAILPGLSGATGTMQTATEGLLTIRVFDCDDRSASGVRYSYEPAAGVPWYYVDGLPSSAAQETGVEGLGGVINNPPGVTQINIAARDGRQIAARKRVAVRPGWMTAVRVWIADEVL